MTVCGLKISGGKSLFSAIAIRRDFEEAAFGYRFRVKFPNCDLRRQLTVAKDRFSTEIRLIFDDRIAAVFFVVVSIGGNMPGDKLFAMVTDNRMSLLKF